MTIMQLVCFAWGLLFAPPPVTFNPFVNFKPIPKPSPTYPTNPSVPVESSPRHWKATECDVGDLACLREHDSRVLVLGIMSGDVMTCWHSTRPFSCAESVRMVLGDEFFPRIESGVMDVGRLAPPAPSRPSGSGNAGNASALSRQSEGKVFQVPDL